jgi:hypothetical protein
MVPNALHHDRIGKRLAEFAAVRQAKGNKAGSASSKSFSQQIVHLVSRSSFGVNQDILNLAEELGEEIFLEWQLDPTSIDDRGLESVLHELFPTQGMKYRELFEAVRSDQQVNPAGDLIGATIVRQLFSPRQLFEVMVEFWNNHFSVFLFKDAVQYLKPSDDRDHVRPHALGYFRDLLHANAASPAMLVYLDNASNTGAGPNENYARELLELHTLGVDGGYDEDDVRAVARAFTGWTLDERVEDLFVFRPFLHDQQSKTVLGFELPAGQGIEDGRAVLDILADHPSTARFIATKLCRHFVADAPPDSLIEKVTQTYMDSDGYIPDLLRSLFLSDEFRASRGEKYKRPAEFLGSIYRTLDPVIGGNFLGQAYQQLVREGQVPFLWHHPDGYPDTQAEWLSTSNLLSRWNFGFAAAFAGQPLGSEDDPTRPDNDSNRRAFLKLPIFRLIDGATTAEALVDQLAERIVHQMPTEQDRQKLIELARDDTPEGLRLDFQQRAAAARRVIAALLASRYFQAR